MDKEWKEGMSLEECVGLMKQCIHELQSRFVMALPKFTARVVDDSGVHPINLDDFE